MSQNTIIQKTFDTTINNQDFMQRVSMTTNVLIELYRMLVSTLLILFVPQDCNGHLCTLKENLVWQDPVYNTSLTVNFITLFAFILLYGVEIVRENRMISYLEVNPENSRDNKSVSTILENLPKTYREEIYSIDSIYQNTSYVCVFFFMTNTILSGITIYKYNYGNQTTTTFITNVLFMTTKMYSTYFIANTDKSIFYSAYLHDRVQYNDIDHKIKTDIEKGIFNQNITHPQYYIQLREPEEFLTHETKENLLIENVEPIGEDVTKEIYDEASTKLPLGFPVELPRQKNQIELEIEFPLGKTFIDLPNEVGPEDPNKEIIDLLRESVKEIIDEMKKNTELRSKESLVEYNVHI